MTKICIICFAPQIDMDNNLVHVGINEIES